MLLSFKKSKGNSYTIAYQLFKIIFNEIKFHENSTEYLTRKEFQPLCRYYSTWMTSRNKYYGHYFAQRIKNSVQFIMESGSASPNVLDCGCGFGSESIAFGLLGAKVFGVDLSTERIDVASKRLNYYKDRCADELDVSFKNINILDYECDKLFDMVYAKEFITHMYSISKFVEFSKRVLKSSGHLIITDANPLNPVVYCKAWIAHKNRLYAIVTDPKTGKDVPYAVERLISPFYLKSLLRQNNFELISNFYGIPLVPFNLVSVIKLFEDKVNLPFLALYEVVSMKHFICRSASGKCGINLQVNDYVPKQ